MNPTMVVFRKELKEMLRDKRVRSNSIIMPMIMMLLMLYLFGFVMGAVEKKSQVIHIIKSENSLVADLKKEGVKVVEVANREEGEKLIRQGKARLVLEFQQPKDRIPKAGQALDVIAYYDPQQDTGKIALAAVSEGIEKMNDDARKEILGLVNLTDKDLKPVQVIERKVEVGKSDTSGFIVGLLPYLIVIYAFYGGFGSASDIVAGEKEKYTLETLLITPVRRTEIALGKFFALASICGMSSLSALMGVVIAGSSGIPAFAKMFPKGLGMDATQFAVIFAVLIPTVAFFGSMLLAVSAFAKNTREAQSHMAIISLIVLMPAIFGQFIGLTDLASNWWIRLVPVLNTSVTLREALQGKTNMLGVALTAAVGVALAIIGIKIAVNLFKREQVLTRV